MEIKTLSASSTDEYKKDIYRLLNMIHAMAATQACNDHLGKWALSRTATYNDYVLTVWTNGIVDIKAETYKDYEGNPTEHIYTLSAVKKED
jgi:hypothetical protein